MTNGAAGAGVILVIKRLFIEDFSLIMLSDLKKELCQREKKLLGPRATLTATATRRNPGEASGGYRMDFALDADRILHSRAYTRYIDKTQVFYLIQNDHITHRVLHVQLVSKIARTMGRFLGLNEDLIEAVSLGHDIGHAPFGHDGETFLSEQCEKHGIGHFQHNLQSVQFLDKVERRGQGWNLCLQTLDGILCHDGEVHNQALRPQAGKTFDDLEAQIEQKRKDPKTALVPMTPEGCLVRMADTISYIGRDIEDAIRLHFIQRSEIPPHCKEVLGDTNGEIVDRLVSDLILNSRETDAIAFSREVSEALRELKNFNLERIYLHERVKCYSDNLRVLFEILFERYLTDIQKENNESVIFTRFLGTKSVEYIQGHQPQEIVRDFIAGMTDQYFLRQCPPELVPEMRILP